MAFDLINHELLLTKLELFCIRGVPLDWLKRYSTNGRLKMKVNSACSDCKPVTAGVLQGSILGSLVLVLFINDVFQLCLNSIEIIFHADNTAILFLANNDNALQLD